MTMMINPTFGLKNPSVLVANLVSPGSLHLLYRT